jgi:hypothetical protein
MECLAGVPPAHAATARLSAALMAHHDVAISAALNESLW